MEHCVRCYERCQLRYGIVYAWKAWSIMRHQLAQTPLQGHPPRKTNDSSLSATITID